MTRSFSTKLALAALALTTLASGSVQSEVPASDLVQALSACFGQYGGYHFSAWIQVGDLDKAAARVNQDDVEIYVDPGFLSDLDAQASYVDYSMAGLQYFNDLVLADQPANIPCNTLWHEVMHAIFDNHDDDGSFLTSDDEMYTWYVEGRLALLERYLVPIEGELAKGADCDPQELDRRWRILERQSSALEDFAGFGAPTQAQIDQIRQLTGFMVPDVATLRQHYEASGLIEACGRQTAAAERARSSRLFLMDNSYSMRGGKIEQSIQSAQSAVGALAPEAEVAVQFFGVMGCDVELVLPFTLDRAGAQATIAQAQASGDTPLAAAIRQGAAYMRASASSGNLVMILLSDGEETCNGDPVAEAGRINAGSSWRPPEPDPLAFSLGAGSRLLSEHGGRRALVPHQAYSLGLGSPQQQRSGGITLHVVGFDIAPGSSTETLLMEVAAAGGGSYFAAGDQAELTEALIAASETAAGGRGPVWTIVVPLMLACLGLIGVGMLLLFAVLTLRDRARARAAG